MAADMPGQCTDNMEEHPVTGDCLCKYGYKGEIGNSLCNPPPE